MPAPKSRTALPVSNGLVTADTTLPTRFPREDGKLVIAPDATCPAVKLGLAAGSSGFGI